MAPRPPLTPLEVLLSRHLGYEPVEWPEILPLPHSVQFSFWVAGKPMAKPRAIPMVSSGGKPFAMTTRDAVERELYVRDAFMNWASNNQCLVPYLPVVEGHARIEVLALCVPAAKNWFPGKRHAKPPDGDNLLKMIKDSLGGRGSGRPSLVWRDDAVVDDSRIIKAYWDATVEDPRYPREPGTCVTIWLSPRQRDPNLWWCDYCTSGFKTEAGLKIHVGRQHRG